MILRSAPRRLTVILLGAVTASAVLACGGQGRGAAPGSPPVAVFPEPTYDFGTVRQGEPIRHGFAVRNEGGSDLVLERVEAAELLRVEGFDEVVPPGGEGAVTVSFDTTELTGAGELEIRVVTDDPEQAEHRLLLTGRVTTAVEVRPQNRVYFLDLPAGAAAEKQLTVVNHQDRPLAILGVEGEEGGWFTAELETAEAGQLYRLTVRLAPGAPAGRFEETLRVETDSPELPSIPIYARASLYPPVRVRPERVELGRVRYEDLERTSVATRHVQVEKRDGEGFQLLSVETDLPFLTLETETVEAGESYMIHIRIDRRRAPRGEVSGTLTLRTNDPDFAELRLPIRGTIL